MSTSYLLRSRQASKISSDWQQYDDMENEEFPVVEYFTAEEYEEFKKRITEYPFLKEKIEPKEKGFDKE